MFVTLIRTLYLFLGFKEQEEEKDLTLFFFYLHCFINGWDKLYLYKLHSWLSLITKFISFLFYLNCFLLCVRKLDPMWNKKVQRDIRGAYLWVMKKVGRLWWCETLGAWSALSSLQWGPHYKSCSNAPCLMIHLQRLPRVYLVFAPLLVLAHPWNLPLHDLWWLSWGKM